MLLLVPDPNTSHLLHGDDLPCVAWKSNFPLFVSFLWVSVGLTSKKGVSIDGTDFVFPQGFKLAPGDFAVIVEKIPAFQLRYPTAGSKNLFKMHGGLK